MLWLSCALVLAQAANAASSLATLIQSGDRASALKEIAAGADVNASQGDGTTPLIWAVYKVDSDLVATLLKHGAKPNVANKYGSTPLAEAVKIADAGIVKQLLAAGADVESPNADGQTALMLAARTGALEIAKDLVAHGANVNAKEAWRGQTALMWAADANQAEIAQLLISKGADVNVRAMANDWDAQITSEPRGQYRPTGGLTALLYAARSGCSRCVRSILGAGADVNRPNPDGITPLMIAIDNFHYDTARLLLDAGANPHVSDWWGRTALYIAADMSSFSFRLGAAPSGTSETTALEVIKRLLDAGVNPNPQLNMHRPGRGGNSGRFVDDLLTTGVTPLLRAAIGHDVDAVRELLAHGAIVDLPNVMGVTPLMGAAGVGVSGRDRRIGLDGDVQTRVIATLDVLIAAGADVNARITDIDSRTARIARISTMTERNGQTALYGAVKFGWTRVVEYLLAHGAKADVVDALGKTPLNAALGQTGGRDNTVSPEIADMLRAATKSGG
jgi:ankyrin repeat protein